MKTTSRKPWCEKGLRISRKPNRPITTTPGACCCSPQNCPRDANWRLPLLRLEVLWKHVCFLGFHIVGKISRKSFVSKHEWKTRGFGSCWSENGVLPYGNTSNLQFFSGKNDGKPICFWGTKCLNRDDKPNWLPHSTFLWSNDFWCHAYLGIQKFQPMDPRRCRCSLLPVEPRPACFAGWPNGSC